VKKLKWWCVVGLAAMGVALSGCGGGGGSSSSVSLRLANATLTHPSLDLLVNSSVALSATTTDTLSAYASPGSGSNTLQVNDAAGTTALATIVPTLTGGSHYTLLAYESAGVVKTLVLGEDLTLPVAGVTTLRIYDVAPEAGPLDVYITASTIACTSTNLTALSATTSFGTLTGPAAVSLTQGSGSYNVCITGSGSKTDIRMSLPITITGQTVATVLMTPASGGALLNGSLLIQQSTTYAAVRNTNARVRLASAVAAQSVGVPSSVAASASDGTVIDSGSVAPSFGFYTLVPASSSLNITVPGGSVAVTSGALVAGGDATLLVYGGPTLTTIKATLLADDNRPPTTAAATKLRLINGITGSTGTLTLTANSAAIGVNVAPGAASSYASVIGTANTTGTANTFSFDLASSTVGSLTSRLPASNVNATLNVNTTYNILAAGDISAPLLLNR
jgi:hypothetical protein